MIDEETNHSCVYTIEHLQSRASCEIKSIKRTSQAVLANSQRALELNNEVLTAAASLWKNSIDSKNLASDLNLLFVMNGRMNESNKYTTKIEEY